MTEVPQATAREEAIELIAALIEAGGSPHLTFEQEAAQMLDALLSPRTVPCAACDGRDDMGLPEGDGVHHGPCPDCTGGSVTLGPLAVLVGKLEQADYVEVERAKRDFQTTPPTMTMKRRAAEPLFRAPFIEAQRESPDA